MTLMQPVAPTVAPETDRPAPDRLIAGDPVFTTWNLEDRDGLYCGIWESTPGTWRAVYDEWEYCYIHAGVLVVTPEDGAPVTYRAGDSFIVRPGWRGTWQVVETVRKDYVIRL
ncbi:cupin domain-containing protein [Pseudooceanicola onchidii]|uniref:cupin domain-containing protein n=1 Tax=Pseudooceanicola onchidii TaxID=2562279 RepID=UPI0010AA6BB2|nr:cupin domain-containing protein [Pseudooceanicola onchidii]